jgi:hypothetical protein
MPACVGRSLRGCFGRYQNVLRIILIDGALRVTAPKEAAPQGLYRLEPSSNKLNTEISLIEACIISLRTTIQYLRTGLFSSNASEALQKK